MFYIYFCRAVTAQLSSRQYVSIFREENMCVPVRQFFLFFIAIGTSASLAPTIDLNDGNKIPVVALGTGRGTAKQNETLDAVHNAVYWAIEAGYRHIDTAAVYKDEEQVGRGIADAIARGLVTRAELFVTTKLWNDKHATEQVVPELRRSLQRLGLDYVDLYLIHFPIAVKEDGTPDDIDYIDTWKGMEEARRLGLTKSIGVSNFNSEQLDRLIANSNVKPAVNQIEVNPTFTQEYLVSHCQELGVAVMAYSPFGFLVSRKTPGQLNIDETKLETIAQKYKKNKSQIILRYLVDRGLIPIPKSTNKERIAQNIDLFDFRLTGVEVATISEYNTNTRVVDASSYKNFPNYPFGKN